MVQHIGGQFMKISIIRSWNTIFLCAAVALFFGLAPPPAQAQIQTVAKKGDQAPGTPTGVTFSTFGPPRITSDGVLSFIATLQGGGVTADNNVGIWVGPRGAMQLLVREGDAARAPRRGTSTSRLRATRHRIPGARHARTRRALLPRFRDARAPWPGRRSRSARGGGLGRAPGTVRSP